ISSEIISVPTTAAALLRVIDDSSRPMQTIAPIGIRYTSRLAYTSSSAFGADTIVPDRLSSELNPDCMLPATTATAPVSSIGAAPVVAEMDRNDEDDRHERRGSETEVGSLLVAELGQLPAIDGPDPGVHEALPVRAATPASSSPPAPSRPSVSEKNKSSSVTV